MCMLVVEALHWLLSLILKALYAPFSDITQSSLLHALAEHDVSLSKGDVESLMKAYDSLGMSSFCKLFLFASGFAKVRE